MKLPPFNTLADWLAWQETLHPEEIELGLDRVKSVAIQLDVINPDPFVIVVGGTNGKGSTVSMLANAYKSAGYNVGCYTSPHLRRYNERVTVNSVPCSDKRFCEAFEAVELARDQVPLTYFEFGTLAALKILSETDLDVIILEVGLGGRLDAVNIIDADLSVVTNIGLDHTDWLGNSRNEIGIEKAGIFRSLRNSVYNDPDPVDTVLQTAARVKSNLAVLGRDYSYEINAVTWNWRYADTEITNISRVDIPQFQVLNAAAVLTCLKLVEERLPVDLDKTSELIFRSLPECRGEWRRININGKCLNIRFDVGHNVEALAYLADELAAKPALTQQGRCTIALYSAMRDKPIESISALMKPVIDKWYLSGLTHVPRACTATELLQRVESAGVEAETYQNAEEAWHKLVLNTNTEDRVVVFGSFYIVEEILEIIERSTLDV